MPQFFRTQPLTDRTTSHGFAEVSSEDHCYCVWLVPAISSDIELRYRTFVDWAVCHKVDFEDMQLPTAPHITLARGIKLKPNQSFKSVLQYIASKRKSPLNIKFGKVAIGDSFYKRVYIQVEKTPGLEELQNAAYDLADTSDPFNVIEHPYMPVIYAKSICSDYSTSDPIETISSIGQASWGKACFLELIQLNKANHQGYVCDRIEFTV